MSTAPDEFVEPTAIRAERAENSLYISWTDGHDSVYSFSGLRWSCPCAGCQGEGGLPGTLASTTELRPDQTELVDLRPVGRYGIAPVWADQHDAGIFTWERLRAACECPACQAKRA